MIPLSYYLALSAVMFLIGAVGVVSRRNALIVFMSIELMLNSVNLTLVAYASFLGSISGHMLVVFVMTVAAAEAAVGLAIIISLFRQKQTVNLEEVSILKW
jgi:NADH-quinone oxidoreductase subunit K